MLNKFEGVLLGAAIGDIIGAAVEAQSSNYIHAKYKNIWDILKEDIITDNLGKWKFGFFTDDTQTIIAVGKWLIADSLTSTNLLEQFVALYEPWRRYGPSMQKIILASENSTNKTYLSRLCFLEGSYGNNSVVRVVPIALRFCKNYQKLIEISRISSSVTHSHRLAIQGAILNAVALMFVLNTKNNFHYSRVINPMRIVLDNFKLYFQDTKEYEFALDKIVVGLKKSIEVKDMVELLGNDITAHKSFPIALYTFLKNYESYEKTIEDVIFVGGDTDSIACMAGALSGAYLGRKQIPTGSINSIRESVYNKAFFINFAKELWHLSQQF